MKCFIGLGNIGKEYRLTKHNIGFIVLDELVQRKSIKFKPGKGSFFFVDMCVIMKKYFWLNLQHI